MGNRVSDTGLLPDRIEAAIGRIRQLSTQEYTVLDLYLATGEHFIKYHTLWTLLFFFLLICPIIL